MQGKKTPKKIKQLQGTYRPDLERVPNSLKYEGMDSYPSPPSDFNLDKMATDIWYWQVKSLVDLKILHDLDLMDLAVYCTEMSRYFRMKDVLQKHGEIFTTSTGYPQPRPEVALMKHAWNMAHAIAIKFGFNPISRDNIKDRGDVDVQDDLQKLMDSN